MKTTSPLLPLLFPLLTLACSAAPPAPPPVPVSDTGVSSIEVEPARPTPAPAKAVSPDVAALVATLVDTGEVTSAGVGYGGTKSASYAAYEALVAAASVEELRALLDHDSPIVRAYVASHLAEHDAPSLPALASRLADASPVDAQYGCLGMRVTVAHHVANKLCYLRNHSREHGAAAAEMLQAAAQDPTSPAHDDARRCLAQPVPKRP